MTDLRIGAIILAGGLSTRMGGFKPLLSIGPKTLLGHTISLFQATGIDDIVVVTGHRCGELQQELSRYPCHSVHNSRFTDGMFSSIQVGVKTLNASHDAFFLHPVDIPLVQQDTIIRLVEAMDQDQDSLVFYPQYQMRRGHPPLIRFNLAEEILSYDDQGGLRGLLKRYVQQSRIVSVDDPYILRDVDTQDDLVFLRREYLKTSLSV